jgi:hypothetical protein
MGKIGRMGRDWKEKERDFGPIFEKESGSKKMH